MLYSVLRKEYIIKYVLRTLFFPGHSYVPSQNATKWRQNKGLMRIRVMIGASVEGRLRLGNVYNIVYTFYDVYVHCTK